MYSNGHMYVICLFNVISIFDNALGSSCIGGGIGKALRRARDPSEDPGGVLSQTEGLAVQHPEPGLRPLHREGYPGPAQDLSSLLTTVPLKLPDLI